MNRRRFSLIATLLVGLGLTTSLGSVRAGGEGTVEGLVRDARGRLLSGVRIRLSLGNLSATTRTDADGTYSISGVQPASGYSLRAKAARYKTSEQSGLSVSENGHTRVDFALIPVRGSGRGVIEGVVADASGAPVRGAKIDVLDGATDGHTTSGRNGKFRLKGLAPGAYSLTAAAAGFTTAILAEVQVGDRNPAEVQVDLQEADENQPSILFGRVRDETGHALTGAQIEIISGPSEGSATTGEEGDYRIEGLAAGSYSLRASAEGFWGNTWDGIELPAGHHVRVDFALHRQQKHEFGAIVGHVRNQEGHAIAGATVEVVEGETHRSAHTDAKGIYRLSDLLPGAYLVQAGKDGYQASRHDVQVRAGHTSELHFVLEREQTEPGAIVGHVRDHEGHAIPEATVEVIEGPTERTAQTNAKGTYRLGDLAEGVYLIQAGKDGFQPKRTEVHVVDGHVSEVHFTLEREHVAQGAVAGHVVDQAGKVVAGATVKVVEGPTSRSTHSNTKGIYRLGDLLVGGYVIEASKDGFHSTRHEVHVQDGKTSELHFVLEAEQAAEGSLVGHVRDGEGHAIVGATVEILEGPHVATNGKGGYEFAHVEPGVYTVRATKDGFHGQTFEHVTVLAGETTTQNFTLVRETAKSSSTTRQSRRRRK